MPSSSKNNRAFLRLAAALALLCTLVASSRAADQPRWQAKQDSLFGATIEANNDGDPTLHFHGQRGWDLNVRLVLYRGRPAFAFPATVWHTFGSIKYSSGRLLIGKDFVAYALESGSKYLSGDDFELDRNQVELTFSYGGTFHGLQFHMKSPGRKISGDLDVCDSKQKTSLLFMQRLVMNFDVILSMFEEAAGLSNLEAQLSPAARYHKDSEAEIAANVQHVKDMKAADKAEKGGGNGLAVAVAILTGAAQAASGQSNSPILNTANQQAAAIRAIGDANAARQQQSAQAALTAQQAAAQKTALSASARPYLGTASSSNFSAPSANNNTDTDMPVVPQPGPAAAQTEVLAQLPQDCLRVSVKLFYDNQPDTGMYYGVNNCGVAVNIDIAMASGYTGATGLHPGEGTFLGASANMGAYKVWYCPYPYWPSDPNNHPENGPVYSANLTSVVCRDPAHPEQSFGSAAGSTR